MYHKKWSSDHSNVINIGQIQLSFSRVYPLLLLLFLSSETIIVGHINHSVTTFIMGMCVWLSVTLDVQFLEAKFRSYALQNTIDSCINSATDQHG